MNPMNPLHLPKPLVSCTSADSPNQPALTAPNGADHAGIGVGRRACLKSVGTFASGAVAFSAGAGGWVRPSPAHASTVEEAEQVVSNAYFALARVFEANHIGEEAKTALKGSVAMMVAPELKSGGFFLGATRGRAVMLRQRADGSWSYPAFYTITAGSVGVQFGFEIAAVAIAIRTRFGFDQVVNGGSDLGVKAGVAAGSKGARKSGSTVGRAKADLQSFAVSEGAFLSVGLDAAVITVEADLASAYYQDRRAAPRAILEEDYFSNVHADPLRQRAEKLVSG